MDNNNPNNNENNLNVNSENTPPPKPRKRVTKAVLRRRQLTALAIIILIFIFIIVGISSCVKKHKEADPNTNTETETQVDDTPVDDNSVEDNPVPEEPQTEPEPETESPTEPETEIPTADPDDPNTITKIELDRHEVYLTVGGSEMPMVTMTPEESPEKGEIWTTSDENIATVDSDGLITGVSPGTCFVTVKSENNPIIEEVVRVTVTDDGYEYTSGTTSERGISPLNDSDKKSKDEEQPQDSVAVAPAPPIYNDEGLTYVKGLLIVNKSYGLPETFAPGLETICIEHFQQLVTDAAEEGLDIWLGSGYRSYYDQVEIYNNYVYYYGQDAADTFSARPGYSEHQTGLTIDCNTIDDAFGYTPEAKWLAENAHKYGFIVRYPYGKQDITGYKYEPWHIRYVGSEAATYMYENDLCLEEYLGVESVYD